MSLAQEKKKLQVNSYFDGERSENGLTVGDAVRCVFSVKWWWYGNWLSFIDQRADERDRAKEKNVLKMRGRALVVFFVY